MLWTSIKVVYRKARRSYRILIIIELMSFYVVCRLAGNQGRNPSGITEATPSVAFFLKKTPLLLEKLKCPKTAAPLSMQGLP